MKVLAAHNFYQRPGGEDQVFRDEVAMLRAHGDMVSEFTIHNDAVAAIGSWPLARKTLWNDAVYRQLREAIRRDRPDVAHFHNTFPLLSPAAYQAARDEGVAVVQTLHNYRLLCPAASLFREGRICEECVGRAVAWPGVVHRCYRDSALASGLSAAMVAYHRQRGTWTSLVDTYIALTEFSRRKFVEAGLPAAKIVVKPNFAEDPGEGPGGGRYAVFVGRLVPEKGIATLLEAWRSLAGLLPLKIVGDGPLRDAVSEAARAGISIEWLGWRPHAEVRALLAAAEMTIFPSEWLEPFGRTIIESFATGTPVVAARVGAVADLVRPGETGQLFEPGQPAELAGAVRRVLASPHQLRAMRTLCRETYLAGYTPRQNYPLLISAYQSALARGWPLRTSQSASRERPAAASSPVT